MENQIEQKIRLLLREAYARKLGIALAFLAISALATAAGATWPKIYTASTTIFVEEKNIIDPLMAGRAVRTDVSAQSQNAREILYSRSLLREVLEARGEVDARTDPVALEEILRGFRTRLWIGNVGDNLIRITYKDSDAEKSYATAQQLAQILIREMRRSKTQESEAAFSFIDRQVQKYEQQLEHTQSELRRLREQNPLAQPGTADQVNDRITQLRGRLDTIEQEIRETGIRVRTLEEQLSGEAAVNTLSNRVDERLERLNVLRNELAQLRLQYQETYPDVVRTRQQIAELEAAIERDSAGSESAGGSRVDPTLRANPVYQRLQQDLYQARSELKLLDDRSVDTTNKLQEELGRAAKIQDLRAEYDKLERDYGINTDIYQDLLRRRENARVSMNLDSEQQALTLRIHEPAYLPHQPAGPRMLHFAVGGMMLAGVLPFSLLFGFLLVDPRLRSAQDIEVEGRVTVLETIPHLMSRRSLRRERRRLILTFVVVFLTVAGVAAALLARHWTYL